MSGRVSVVVPAHDEASVIGRLLRQLIDTDVDERLEILVVANGCTDATVAVATGISPRIRVVEIAQASKIAALNAGDEAAGAFPRAYVDADVMVSAQALLAVADGLSDNGALLGAPRFAVDTHGASVWVRQYYRIWEHSDYHLSGLAGSGVFVLSASGREHFGVFPDIIADDLFVLRTVPADRRLAPVEHTFTVLAPKDFRTLLRRQTRIAAGNRQLRERFPELAQASAGHQRNLLKRVARRPGLWASLPAYAVGYAIPRLRERWYARRGRDLGWNRDDTTRVG